MNQKHFTTHDMLGHVYDALAEWTGKEGDTVAKLDHGVDHLTMTTHEGAVFRVRVDFLGRVDEEVEDDTSRDRGTRQYGGARQMAANGGEPEPENDWLRCSDCGRPMYYDTSDEAYHHAIAAGDGCFLIPDENRVDDLDHPLLDNDTNLVDAEYAAYEARLNA